MASRHEGCSIQSIRLTDNSKLTMQKVWLDTSKVIEVKKHIVGTLVCNTPEKK